MIPVARQRAPKGFNEKVKNPGVNWLKSKGIALNQPPPDPAALPPFWRACQKDLWKKYRGICAYLCVYFEWSVGAQSTDHFIAKSSNAGQAYEWDNYRLCCLGMNRNKNRFDDILDPFEIKPDTFILNLASGEIKPNPALPPATRQQVLTTIRRLRLDSRECKEMRANMYYEYYTGNVSEEYLGKKSPFVWYEAKRQGLL